MIKYKFVVCVLTFNGGDVWRKAAEALRLQTEGLARVIVIDSSSHDGSDRIAQDAGFEVQRIPSSTFDHGGTRQGVVDQISAEEIIVFLTQDAVLRPGAIREILASFTDPSVAMAYGRQLPHPGAGPVEAHARCFNYPSVPMVKGKHSISALGIKTPFCSNSFSAYRIEALRAMGGFPDGLLFGEDMYVAAKFILSGRHIVYAASAQCEHSHNYSGIEEFKRAFDIGAFHAMNPWLLKEFGSANSEGGRFVLSELRYVFERRPLACLSVLMRNTLKYLGYRLGRKHNLLSTNLKLLVTCNKAYWSRETAV
ncbi:MAG: glycosyltransferase [Gammaproteobacteria bacterium]